MKEIKESVQSIIHTLENLVGTEIDVIDYLEGTLEITWVLDCKGDYEGAKILVTFGGPNIWIDTSKKIVEGYWWNDSHIESYDGCVELDDFLMELWGCEI